MPPLMQHACHPQFPPRRLRLFAQPLRHLHPRLLRSPHQNPDLLAARNRCCVRCVPLATRPTQCLHRPLFSAAPSRMSVTSWSNGPHRKTTGCEPVDCFRSPHDYSMGWRSACSLKIRHKPSLVVARKKDAAVSTAQGYRLTNRDEVQTPIASNLQEKRTRQRPSSCWRMMHNARHDERRNPR